MTREWWSMEDMNDDSDDKKPELYPSYTCWQANDLLRECGRRTIYSVILTQFPIDQANEARDIFSKYNYRADLYSLAENETNDKEILRLMRIYYVFLELAEDMFNIKYEPALGQELEFVGKAINHATYIEKELQAILSSSIPESYANNTLQAISCVRKDIQQHHTKLYAFERWNTFVALLISSIMVTSFN